MDDFYKNIKDSVEGLTPSTPSDKDWTRFQSYRDGRDQSSPKPFPWLLASTLGLITLLIGSNIFWASRSVDTSLVATSTSVIHDTIYITKVIDYTSADLTSSIADLETQLALSQQVQSELSRNFNFLQSRYDAQIGTLNKLYTQLNQQDTQLSKWANLASSTPSISPSKSSLESILSKNYNDSKRSLISLSGLPFAFLDELDYNRGKLIHPSNIIWIKNEKPFNLLEAITPKSLSLNLNAGLHKGLSRNYSNGSGTMLELRASTIFTKHVRGFIGVTSYDSNLEVEDDMSYPNIPTISIPEGDELKETKVATSNTSLNIGLEYMLYTNSKFRPHFGLGYAQSISN